MSIKFDEFTKSLAQAVKRRAALKKFCFGLVGLALACAALVTGTKAQPTGLPPKAAALFGNIGGAFVITDAGAPGLFNVTADAIGNGSVLGNFTDSAHLQAQFPPPGSPDPVLLNGQGTWTTSNGQSSISLSFTGTATPDPDNQFVFNNLYQATITGGTGAFVGATGVAAFTEVVKFNADYSGGTASLVFKGYVVTRSSRH